MPLSTITSASLLASLKDHQNATAWHDYLGRYRPLVVRYLQRTGLHAADAEDVAQEALLAFATSYRNGKYDPARGRLRSWLFGIAQTVLRNWQRRNHRRERQVVDAPDDATGVLGRIADDDHLAALWDEEWQEAVLRQCLAEVRAEVEEKTFRAFERFALEGVAASDVAAELGMTENAVFGAKRRVLDRVKALRPALDDVF